MFTAKLSSWNQGLDGDMMDVLNVLRFQGHWIQIIPTVLCGVHFARKNLQKLSPSKIIFVQVIPCYAYMWSPILLVSFLKLAT